MKDIGPEVGSQVVIHVFLLVVYKNLNLKPITYLFHFILSTASTVNPWSHSQSP